MADIKKEQDVIVDVVGDSDDEEETKENKAPTPKNANAKRKSAESTPNTSKKNPKMDPELELIGNLLGQAEKEIDPHGNLKKNIRIAKTYFSFNGQSNDSTSCQTPPRTIRFQKCRRQCLPRI